MSHEPIQAIIVDLDGVVTDTASVHARAWKEVFDDVLRAEAQRTGDTFEPFTTGRDYPAYVDGRPRIEGVRTFLASRGIERAEGGPDDPPDVGTLHAVAARKNRRYLELLEHEGVHVYERAVKRLREWRQAGLPIAVVTSSRNASDVLCRAGLADLFDAQVDGEVAASAQLAGKPAPDTFIYGARQLGVEPRQAVVAEDAVAGVRAGRAGGFGVVLGIGPPDRAEALREAGADVVAADLGDVTLDDLQRVRSAKAAARDSAMGHLDILLERFRHVRPVLFLDYDGTLTEIQPTPEQATLPDATRTVLRRLAQACTVAVVSGRDLDDVRALVDVPELIYAGSHGMDIAGPNGLREQSVAAAARVPDLDAAQRRLEGDLRDVPGVLIERKRFALAVHYRNVAGEDVPRVADAVDRAAAAHPKLRRTGGKKVFELRPAIDWDKGRAVRWLLDVLNLAGPDALPVYIGDDETDEDAFRALRDAGVGIGVCVGRPEWPSAATYRLDDVNEVVQLLVRVAEAVRQQSGTAVPG